MGIIVELAHTKKWYHSKTIWANLIGVIAIIISTVAANEEVAQEIMTAEASILAIINLILRVVTKQGLEK